MDNTQPATATRRRKVTSEKQTPSLFKEEEMPAYMVTYWVCYGNARNKRPFTTLFESSATGLQFGRDMIALCRNLAADYAKKNIIHYVNIENWSRLP